MRLRLLFHSEHVLCMAPGEIVLEVPAEKGPALPLSLISQVQEPETGEYAVQEMRLVYLSADGQISVSQSR